jgi:hypothetical protein
MMQSYKTREQLILVYEIDIILEDLKEQEITSKEQETQLFLNYHL